MMEDKRNNESAYSRELVALIKSGIKPEEAKSIADSHFGNYSRLVEQVAKERKEQREVDAKQQAYARVLSARINAGENPKDVVKDMENFVG